MTVTDQEQFDRNIMLQCIKLAQAAAETGEVPVAAIIVAEDGLVLGQGQNRREAEQSATAHAEIAAIQEANRSKQSWRLNEATLYCTLEPCVMCAGAIVHARIKRVVFGARDPKGGAVRSCFHLLESEQLNHSAEVVEGVLESECAELLTEFFTKIRQKKTKPQKP